jgi:hypothetical protein
VNGFSRIVVDAARDEVAIQADVVDAGPPRSRSSRLADFRERVDVVQRVGRLAEVDEQDVWASGYRHDWTALRRPPL